MAEIGKTNTLKAIKRVDFGMYLDGGDLGEILLPNRYVPVGCKPDDMIDVFLYFDSEDRLIATTDNPKAQVGECAHMEVISKSNFGAFMNWGLTKDLFVPFKEQREPMIKGNSYTVFLFIDNSGRIAASSKLSSFLKETGKEKEFKEDQEVSLQISSRSNMGLKAIINKTHLGLIHNNDINRHIAVGDKIDGYIKKVRKDGRIDLKLEKNDSELTDSISNKVIEFIKKQGGSTNITDKSSPGDIYIEFKISKSLYKRTLGKLYKAQLILIDKDIIRLP